MTFRIACTAAAVLLAGLFVIMLVSAQSYAGRYGVFSGVGGDFLGRRASPAFLGLAMLLWLLRDHGDVQVQRAVCYSAIAVFGGIAVTGFWAYFDGTASGRVAVIALLDAAAAAVFYWLCPKT
ncbi:hypothetical protein FHS72_001184 [Loktanella ponticola]|uniref:DUF4345 domain-containing protein n=1 Tax=Yoonia ponticola TaxID=1524255 RepID=A0A7W9BJ87_9RHOB|nr:hypothetical protein [Yoonia ponticola]MBB5721572.1 hypothetical protein [Yoonia ponticola]